ncbi:hypothetical protein SK128_004140 [Halocaridina rubra]|uniref:Uncharacterized protein n=1 Tax=Halocaridina rubra TaxID=373956 RepID=A0AAN9ADN5_HALRR
MRELQRCFFRYLPTILLIWLVMNIYMDTNIIYNPHSLGSESLPSDVAASQYIHVSFENGSDDKSKLLRNFKITDSNSSSSKEKEFDFLETYLKRKRESSKAQKLLVLNPQVSKSKSTYLKTSKLDSSHAQDAQKKEVLRPESLPDEGKQNVLLKLNPQVAVPKSYVASQNAKPGAEEIEKTENIPQQQQRQIQFILPVLTIED